MMNKRIKELLEQSGLQPYYDAQEGQIEKFAELIVRECAKVSRKYAFDGIRSDEYEDCGIECMPKDMERFVKEHFGVEV